jgi:hypothetical protein
VGHFASLLQNFQCSGVCAYQTLLLSNRLRHPGSAKLATLNKASIWGWAQIGHTSRGLLARIVVLGFHYADRHPMRTNPRALVHNVRPQPRFRPSKNQPATCRAWAFAKDGSLLSGAHERPPKLTIVGRRTHVDCRGQVDRTAPPPSASVKSKKPMKTSDKRRKKLRSCRTRARRAISPPEGLQPEAVGTKPLVSEEPVN